MQAYSELAAPTAVCYSLSLPLTSASANNLVVAKGSLLQIFATETVSVEIDHQNQPDQTPKLDQHFDRGVNDDDGLESSFLGGDTRLVRTDRANHIKLLLVAEIPLAGTVVGMARMRLKNTASGGEALLLAYRAAKMCLTEWDPTTNTLETTSIHYYEKDELQGAPWELAYGCYVNYLAADPSSRCAALKFGSRNLAILPFRQSKGDLEMDDWDEDLDGPRPVKDASVAINGDPAAVEAAYTPSFVLRLPLLDPSLLHPAHLAFLHEYHEPTFGILSSTQDPSISLGLMDHMTYKVFTLDLQQRASTAILSVTGLPQDLYKVIALPAPVGGALLVGQNELIHVDQSGKSNGVAVNSMTKKMTSYSLIDQSDLGLRLEGCAIELLSIDVGELLLVLNDGRIGIVSFKVDGRTVSGLGVQMVTEDCGGGLIMARVSTASKVDKHAVFLGSEDGDSVVLGWSRRQGQEKRKRSRLLDAGVALDMDELELEGEEEDDDLYGEDSAAQKTTHHANGTSKPGDLVFRVHDSLLSVAPIRHFTCGAPTTPSSDEQSTLRKGVAASLELACAVGRGRAGSVAIINREIQPKVIGRFEFPEARGLWTMFVKKLPPSSLGTVAAVVGEDYDTAGQYDELMIVAKVDLDGYETSDVYALTAAGFETLKDTEFEPAAGFTIEAGTMGKQMRLVQVLKSEIRCYDGDLGLVQILPMLDEETGAEPRATSASIADPYLLLVRDDSSAFVARILKNNELEEIDKADKALLSTKWLSGCLYKDKHGVFQPFENEREDGDDRIMMFLLSMAGSLHVYSLPDLSKAVYVAENLCFVPPFLSPDYTVRRGSSREVLSEILVANLGDATSQRPYLILRNSHDDLTIYEPIRHQGGSDHSLAATLIFKKSPNPALAKSTAEISQDDDTDETRFVPLRRCDNINGYSTVFLPGASPSFVLKTSKSIPRVVGLQGVGVRGMSAFHTEGCDRGFIYADSQGIARVTQLPVEANYTELGLSVRKMPLDADVSKVVFHHPTGSYVVACNVTEAFTLPRDDDYHREWAKEDLSFPPTTVRSLLKLVNPVTWTVIHTVELEPCESVESMEALQLEVSEETKERRMLVAVGTAISKGEDLPTRGRVQVFDVVTVVPEPGRPETNKRLKRIAKEEIPRGGVTALSEIGTQGLMLVAQGQKCMVRGLKEDGSLLPVAFLDMSCHVVSARELPGTGLCIIADAFKGVWFAGYTEEPYTFQVLGKSGTKLPLIMADFLPDSDDLSIVAVDMDGDMHILEFNPEHPKSLRGHLLLHRTTLSVTPNVPTSMLLLPRTLSVSQSQHEPASRSSILLLASSSGQLAALTPLAESTYRRLLSVTNQLVAALPAHGGLNSKAFRMSESGVNSSAGIAHVGVETASGRVVVDAAAVLSRWNELGAGKRAEISAKGGYDDVDDLREELERVLGWSGLGYF